MKYPAYPKYKPSGVEWLGEVPEHWEVKRGRFCMNINPRSNHLRQLKPDDEVSFVPMEAVGEYGGLNLEVTKPLGEIGTSYTEFENGDVLVAKITPCFENGKGAIADGLTNGVALGTTELHVLRVLAGLNRRFLFYFTISSAYRMTGVAEMYGAGGQKRVPPEFSRNFRLTLPPLPEQHAIADFLDRETAKLDTLVAKKRELIQKLKEKRTALISRTVTRGLPPEAARAAGLNPHPKLKPSGIEWLGEVPEHWEVKMIKRTWSVCEYGISESLSGDGPIRVLTMGNIQEGRVIIPDDGCLETVSQTMLLKKNDLLFNRTNSLVHIGKVGLFDGDERLEVTFASYLVRIRTNAKMSPQFLSYYLNIPQLLEFARSLALPSINQANLNPTRYGQIKIAIPPLNEQRALADYLDRETAKIDQMAAKVEEALARLQEYRTALITAAVTGKIEVRKYKDAAGVQHQSRG